jgi:hypothetical protein
MDGLLGVAMGFRQEIEAAAAMSRAAVRCGYSYATNPSGSLVVSVDAFSIMAALRS